MKNSLFVKFSATKKMDDVDYLLKKTVRDAIIATMKHENIGYDTEISVTFCDNAHIRKINKAYRGVDKHTDVLSFPLYDAGEIDDNDEFGAVALGDIVISLERAKEQAAELGHGFYREVAFLTIHSMLHLLGYDHEKSSEDEEKQCLAQRDIIENMEI